METAVKQSSDKLRYLLTNTDQLSIYQVEYINGLRKHYRRYKRLSEKQLAVLNEIHQDIKETKMEL